MSRSIRKLKYVIMSAYNATGNSQATKPKLQLYTELEGGCSPGSKHIAGVYVLVVVP